MGDIHANTEIVYDIEIPLPDGVNTFVICSCMTPAAVAEIVKSLTTKEARGPATITIRVRHVN